MNTEELLLKALKKEFLSAKEGQFLFENASTADLAFTDIFDPSQYSDYYLESASFLRCENIVIGYTLDKNVFKDVNIKLYGAVNNPFIITNYSGQDPENFGGIDNNFYPRPTVYNIGVNIDF